MLLICQILKKYNYKVLFGNLNISICEFITKWSLAKLWCVMIFFTMSIFFLQSPIWTEKFSWCNVIQQIKKRCRLKLLVGMNMIYYLHGIDKSSFQQFKTDSLFTDNNNRQSLFLIKLKECMDSLITARALLRTSG